MLYFSAVKICDVKGVTRYSTEKEGSTDDSILLMRQNMATQIWRRSYVCGLFVSLENPWLVGTPDDIVHDSTKDSPSSLVEIKNPYSVKDLPLSEAVKKPAFCLEKKGESLKYSLKHRHDYFYQQIQCRLHCT